MSDHRLALVLLIGLPRSGDAMTRLLLVRHGRTEMNEWMSKPGKGWGAPGFVDPALWDTRLTPTGEMQARELNSQMRSWHPEVDLLLASPLRRALATAEIGIAWAHPPTVSTVLGGGRAVKHVSTQLCFIVHILLLTDAREPW